MKDIRLCPYRIETVDGGNLARVYRHNGFKCWLSEVVYNYPHAAVYKYTLQYPNGYCQRNMDLSDANKVVFADV